MELHSTNSTSKKKPKQNRLQQAVLARLELGLPPTPGQQLQLHFLTALRAWRRLTCKRICYHSLGILGICFRPLPLFHFCRVPVQLHSTFLFYPAGFLAWSLFCCGSYEGLLWAFLVLLVLSTSLLAHEYAHIFAARCWGIGSRRIMLIPIGAFAELESKPEAPCEIWIALAGPAMSLFLVGVCSTILRGTCSSIKCLLSDYSWFLKLRYLLRFGYGLNLNLAAFNLLPCFPMDGGRILRSTLAVIISRLFQVNRDAAFRVATQITVRYVTWFIGLGAIGVCIFFTRIWMHLLLFPLLIACAESEYRELLNNPHPPDPKEASPNGKGTSQT